MPVNHPSLTEYTDQELALAYARDADDAALVTLLRRYEVALYGYCRKLMGGRDELAKDLFQETLSVAIDQLGQHKHISHFNAYFFRLAHHKAADHFRKLRREKEFLEAHQRNLEEGLQRFTVNRRFEQAGYREGNERRWVERGIETLEGLQADAARQFFLEGATYREIADQTGKSPANVKSALQQGKIKLKNWLIRHYNKE